MALPGVIWKPPWTRIASASPRLPRYLSQLRPPPPPPFPVVETCPSPTCSCAATPSGLDINHRKPLSGTMPSYNQHVVICTGKDNWPSRIEDEIPTSWGGRNLAKELKSQLGPKRAFHDPYSSVMITNSSFTVDPHVWLRRSRHSSIYLFPRFQYLSIVSHSSLGAETLIRKYLLGPNQLRPSADDMNTQLKYHLNTHRHLHQEVTDVIVLICGHGGRDQRCGVMGPLLGLEFQRSLTYRGAYLVCGGGRGFSTITNKNDGIVRARVGLVSHIGGHQFAGNVVIYIPPTFTVQGKKSPLAGKGIWYGRVEPKHVEGIVEETIFKGNVIAELFRGGIEQGGNILRL